MTSEVIDLKRRAAEDAFITAAAASHRGRAGGGDDDDEGVNMLSTQLVHPDSFLRRVLFTDAAVSVAVGALMGAAATPLGGLLGLPASLLGAAGLALFPYAAYLVWIATRRAVPRAAVWVPVVLNIVWAVDCVLVAFAGGFSPSALGQAFLAMHVVTVLVFAELEFVGLRRAPPATA